MSTKLLDLVNITKSYDGVTILDDLNLYIRENEFLTLLGPSGCGKTTSLRILGGFADSGNVQLNRNNSSNSKEFIVTHDSMGYVTFANVNSGKEIGRASCRERV